jgi:hypothetical protein
MPIGPDTDRQGSGRAHRDFDPVQYAWAEEQAAEAGNPAPIIYDDGSRQEHDPAHGWLRDDLGDLVDPQNDTYEEEGTHGLPLLAAAARPLLGKMAGAAATSFGMKAGSNLADKATGGSTGY